MKGILTDSDFFHNYLKYGDSRHYEWKFKIQKVDWNVYSAEKRIHFHSNRKNIVHVRTCYYQFTPPFPVRIFYRPGIYNKVIKGTSDILTCLLYLEEIAK